MENVSKAMFFFKQSRKTDFFIHQSRYKKIRDGDESSGLRIFSFNFMHSKQLQMLKHYSYLEIIFAQKLILSWHKHL